MAPVISQAISDYRILARLGDGATLPDFKQFPAKSEMKSV
jgi:hypothetical protein